MNSNVTYGTSHIESSDVGDDINSLPTDQLAASEEDLRLVDTLFKKNDKTLRKLAVEFKDLFIIGILYIIFSLPQTDTLIQKIPIAANSPYILVGIKTLAFMILFWIIKYFQLSRVR